MPRRIASLVLALALGIGVLYELLWPGHAPGVNVPVLVGMALLAAFIVSGADAGGRMDPVDAWLAPAALVFAGFAAVRADPWLVAADLVFAAALAVGAFAALGGARITRGAVAAVMRVAVGAVLSALVGGFRVAGALRPARGMWPRRRLPPVLVPVARGVLLAVPVLLVFGFLFAAADAVFAAVAGRVLDVRIDLDLDTATRVTVDIGVVAWAVAGLLLLAAVASSPLGGAVEGGPLWSSSDGSAEGSPEGVRATRPMTTAATTRPPASRSVEATTILVLLDFLFGAFVVLQVAYLFGGRDTLATAGLTYAEYARRGFFELVAVAALAALLVAALDVAVPRRSRTQLAASAALLALTGVVLVSAFQRLSLYQAAYGWTELRFVVVAGIAWLAAGLLATAVLLARRRTAWLLHALGILLLVGLAGMNLVGPQAFVAERNLERALNPALVPAGGWTGLDPWYLSGLGDEAVPAVVAVLDRLEGDDRRTLDRFLERRELALATDPSLTGWPSWNAARERAREALVRWRAAENEGTVP